MTRALSAAVARFEDGLQDLAAEAFESVRRQIEAAFAAQDLPAMAAKAFEDVRRQVQVPKAAAPVPFTPALDPCSPHDPVQVKKVADIVAKAKAKAKKGVYP